MTRFLSWEIPLSIASPSQAGATNNETTQIVGR
jgi:hypothetical protein